MPSPLILAAENTSIRRSAVGNSSAPTADFLSEDQIEKEACARRQPNDGHQANPEIGPVPRRDFRNAVFIAVFLNIGMHDGTSLAVVDSLGR
jgi:hypothetical protein